MVLTIVVGIGELVRCVIWIILVTILVMIVFSGGVHASDVNAALALR